MYLKSYLGFICREPHFWDGMAVIMPPNTSASLCEIESESTAQLKFNEAPLSNFYELGDELGCGQFASVRRVVERSTGDLYAGWFHKMRSNLIHRANDKVY
jgi:hypothetical protein